MIIDLVNSRSLKTMVEVGVFTGGSARQWLDGCHDLHVYGVDPFPIDAGVGEYFARTAHIYRHLVDLGGMTDEEFIAQMSEPDSLMPAMLSNLWDYRDRFTPVRACAPQALIDLAAAGVTPDLVFLDAMKTCDELPVIRDLWPNCIITGDDWSWQDDTGHNPLHSRVLNFADWHRQHVRIDRTTWMLEPKT